jgi:hypothetical protein
MILKVQVKKLSQQTGFWLDGQAGMGTMFATPHLEQVWDLFPAV